MYEILNRIITFNGTRLYFRHSLSWFMVNPGDSEWGHRVINRNLLLLLHWKVSVSQWLNSPLCAEYLRKDTFCLYHASIIKWHIVPLCARGMGSLRAKPKITVICFVSTPKHYHTNILSTQYDGCWWPGDVRQQTLWQQGINWSIDILLVEFSWDIQFQA